MADGADAAIASSAAPCRLLCVDDDPMVLSALRRLLERHDYEVLLAGNGADGLRVLERTPVDVVIADMRMPGLDGAQFLAEVRARWPETIRFLLTAYADHDSAVAAINRGGISRYLAKPWDHEEILEAIRHALHERAQAWRQHDELRALNHRLSSEVREYHAALQEAQQDILKVQEARNRAAYLAHHDSLTGLPNRLLLGRRLQDAIDQAQRQGTMLAVLFVDLDHFKEVNDRFGHEAGDVVLQDAARAMQAVLRPEDTLARLGGDEFVGLVPGIENEAAAVAAAERLLAVFPRYADRPDGRIAVGASIGVSLYPRDGLSPAQLIDNADAAMYCAKAAGRSGLRLASPSGR